MKPADIEMKIPAHLALHEGGILTLSADGGEDDAKGPKTASGVAYSGHPVRGFFGPMVVDLKGMRVSGASQFWINHDPNQIAGKMEARIDGDQLRFEAQLFTEEEATKKLARLQSQGMKWQASMGFAVDKVSYVERDEKITVNGKEYTGPVVVLSKTELLEISAVPIGADQKTSVVVGLSGFSGEIAIPRGVEMADENKDTKTSPAATETPKADPGPPIAEIKLACGGNAELVVKALEERWSVIRCHQEYSALQAVKIKELEEGQQKLQRKYDRLQESPGVEFSAPVIQLEGDRDLSRLEPHDRAKEEWKGVPSEKKSSFARFGNVGGLPIIGAEEVFTAAREYELLGVVDYQDPLVARMTGEAWQQWAASKKGFYDLLDNRALVGTFYRRLEMALTGMWAMRVAFFNAEANQRTETYGMLGASPMLRKWIGGRQTKQVKKYSQAITNEVYETTLRFSTDDLRRDKTGQIAIRIADGAGKTADHWNKIATTEIEANNTAYDGVALYATTHNLSGANAINNAPTVTQVPALGVTDKTDVTVQEATKIMAGLATYMYGWLDEDGDPLNGASRKFIFQVAIAHMAAFQAGASAGRLNTDRQESGALLRPQEFSVEIVPNPRKTGNDDHVFGFIEDTATGGIILQEEEGVQTQVLGRGSDHEFHNREQLFGVTAIRGIGPGEFSKTIRGTLSNA